MAVAELYTIHSTGECDKSVIDVEQGNHYHLIELMENIGWKLIDWSATKTLYIFRASNGDVGVISC